MDENITAVGRMREILGAEVTAELERPTLRAVYTKGRDVALERGIIIADTKPGVRRTKDGEIILIDEVMTPDSSALLAGRRLRARRKPQPSFDKQPARLPTSSAMLAAGTATRPRRNCSPEVVEATSKRYLEAYRRLDRQRLHQRGGTVMWLSRRRRSR